MWWTGTRARDDTSPIRHFVGKCFRVRLCLFYPFCSASEIKCRISTLQKNLVMSQIIGRVLKIYLKTIILLTCRCSCADTCCSWELSCSLSSVGTEPGISLCENLRCSIPSKESLGLLKHSSLKCAEHNETLFPGGGTGKSGLCRCTNFAHFALNYGSFGNSYIFIPGV